MTKFVTLTSIAALTAVLGTASFAQETALNTSGAADQNEDLRDSIADDFERDAVNENSNRGRALGFAGSVAASGSIADGNSDSANVGIGVDLGYYDGVNGYGLELAYAYSEADGVVDKDQLTYEFEYLRDFSPALFGFAKVQGNYQGLDAVGDDVFVGFGVGYRIYDTADLQWTVQAGPGYRVASLTDLDTDVEGGAIGISSNYYNRIDANSAISVNTDIIVADDNTALINNIAFTQNVSNALALRTSLETKYNSDPLGNAENTDNTLGVSLVYSFN